MRVLLRVKRASFSHLSTERGTEINSHNLWILCSFFYYWKVRRILFCDTYFSVIRQAASVDSFIFSMRCNHEWRLPVIADRATIGVANKWLLYYFYLIGFHFGLLSTFCWVFIAILIISRGCFRETVLPYCVIETCWSGTIDKVQ